jgi:hypothetical protein
MSHWAIRACIIGRVLLSYPSALKELAQNNTLIGTLWKLLLMPSKFPLTFSIRRLVMPAYFSSDVFSNILRYLIMAAQNKRFVPYNELENVFGLSHNMAGFYAGKVGDFCLDYEWPLLNALIISTTECRPSHGFDDYLVGVYNNWGDCISDCFKTFHLSTSRAHQVKNFSGLTKLSREWASSLESQG